MSDHHFWKRTTFCIFPFIGFHFPKLTTSFELETFAGLMRKMANEYNIYGWILKTDLIPVMQQENHGTQLKVLYVILIIINTGAL